MVLFDTARAQIAELTTENRRLLLLLQKARQYVADAASSAETKGAESSTALLAEIDQQLIANGFTLASTS